MKRVAHVIGQMGIGGVETVLLNLYRKLDKEAIQFDFIVHKKEEQAYDQEILGLGGHIYYVCPKKKNLYLNLKQTTEILKGYDAVHIHLSSAIGVLDGLCAMKGGVRVRILHTHNSSSKGLLRRWGNWLLKPLVPLVATDLLACSNNSARYMFPKRVLTFDNYHILNNGIDTARFAYNPFIREETRSSLGIAGCPTVVQVGRLCAAKNFGFTLEAFAETKKKLPEAVLLLVGDGPFMEDLKRRVKELGLSGAVYFLGIRRDVNQLLFAADLFVMPSVYEGFPGAGVEAQASGIKCLFSDRVTESICLIPENCERLSIDGKAEIWSEKMTRILRDGYERQDQSRRVREAGYDIGDICTELVKIYD